MCKITSLLCFLHISMIHSVIITNKDIPSCRNCIYYKVEFYSDYNSQINKCLYFGKKNIETDIIKYDFAGLCRMDENQCGLSGKYFQEDPNIGVKILLHNVMKNTPTNILLLFQILFFIYFINLRSE